MSDIREDISNEDLQIRESLDFTEEELLAELAEHFDTYVFSDRQPGDLDYDQLQDRFGFSKETIRRKMVQLEKQGLWERVYLCEEGRRIVVFRKVRKNGNSRID